MVGMRLFCLLLLLCFSGFGDAKRNKKSLMTRDQQNGSSTPPLFSENLVPRILLCEVDKPCSLVLPVDGKHTQIPNVQDGHRDPGLKVEPIAVWSRQPFICNPNQTRCPYEAVVTVIPTEERTYQYCVQTTTEEKINADELCFMVQGIRNNFMNATPHFNYPPSFPNNSTVSCPKNVTCHYAVELQRHGGYCIPPKVNLVTDIDIHVHETEVKQRACKYDVEYTPSVHATGNKAICLSINKSTVETHCVNVEVTSLTRQELAGPCSRIYCSSGSFCDSVNGRPICLCPPGFTGTSCTHPVQCYLSFPKSVTCPKSNCHVTGITIGTRQVFSNGNIVSYQQDAYNGKVIIANIEASGNASEICYHVNQANCYKEGCVSVIPDNQLLSPTHMPGGFSNNNLTYNCNTGGNCYLTIITYPTNNNTCPNVTAHPNTTVNNHHIFRPSTFARPQCTTTVLVTGSTKPGENQQLCLQTRSDVKCIHLTVKDFEKCSTNPCENGGSCEALLTGYKCTCKPGWTGNNCKTDINECSPDRCQNGICHDEINNYTCTCDAGYTGRNCETDINECSPDPCQNGSCRDVINGYICTCHAGYTGRTCGIDINECNPDPCQHGICHDGVNNFTCTCFPGFTGRHCETDKDECSPDPCVNGTCTDGINNYTCVCDAGFSGNDCGKNIDECSPDPCVNGTCIDGINSYTCICDAGFSGRACRTNVDECSPDPCVNGTCIDGINNYTCVCDAGFSGHVCGTNVDECSPDPCENGTCIDGINNYTCVCDAGFSGRVCNTNIDECSPDPCVTGTCVDGINNYTCVCDAGFSGRVCGTNIDECYPSPCVNGTCMDEINNYTCVCDFGFSGRVCGTNIDDCLSNPCQNRGVCYDGVNSYVCRCDRGYTGQNCGKEIDECLSDPCLNGATCSDLVNGFKCSCKDGYSGLYCENRVAHCLPGECLNGGTCVTGNCQCQAGYTGEHCEIYLDPCHSSPCLHGDCYHHNTNFYCDCKSGYTGKMCETLFNNCDSNPCVSGGSCTNGDNYFTCSCLPGFTGNRCQTNIDDCLSKPCMNGGNCKDEINSFTCQCQYGYSGDRCETVTDFCLLKPCVRGTCFSRASDYHCTCPTGYTGKTCNTTVMVVNGPDRVNLTVPRGGDIRMNCSVTGQPTAYSWTKKNGCGGVYDTAGGSNLEIHNAGRGDAGIYMCSASNKKGSNVTRTFYVTVNASKSDKCVFDGNAACDWTQLNNTADDKFDWTRQKGSTQSSETGPDNDHTVGNGNGVYMYIEASSPRLQGDYASLMSQVLPANHTMCLEFWYFMYGDGIGNLTIDLKDRCLHKDTQVFKRTGDQGQKWIKASVTIPSHRVPNDYTIVLTGDIGPTYHGDTAIDDLSISEGKCTNDQTSSSDVNVPIIGIYLIHC
ncbi:fibropellin-1-like isoform X3 [Mercenaria mercenaria]|uniref:fibropellin-1-like isoform X3 n=1 Tax=Mercenaria mercenaria TaxID=6596 RepID=UPI00234E3A0E|nr:fibropellin-1-like isoform X3 [Mercenaria mercenaria]